MGSLVLSHNKALRTAAIHEGVCKPVCVLVEIIAFLPICSVECKYVFALGDVVPTCVIFQ